MATQTDQLEDSKPQGDQPQDSPPPTDEALELAPKRRPNRRRKRDILLSFFMWISIICWGFFVAAIIFIQQATPEIQNVFSRHLELELREEWDMEAMANALDLMHYVAGFSLLALLLKAMRHRRRADRYPITFVILFICSVLGIYLVKGDM
jgi:hypothetical protein